MFIGILFGLNNLYWYYQTDVRSLIEIEPHLNPELEDGEVNAELFFGR